ncbi:MAG: redoxin domain-containing protein [Chloroflexaceae bacterium]|nr:redoxin domain-containing protein [Chloroflexaceae bacterium]
MSTLYALLGVDPDASQEAIERAYAQQRMRYAPEQIAELDPELQQVAAQRNAELERAYRILGDPERRRQYDSSLSAKQTPGKAPQRGLTPRERAFAIAGALVAVGLIALFWVLTGQNDAPRGQAMSEMNRPAPLFAAPALDGGTVRLEDYRGQVVLLNFWGTWCEPCKRELPALQAAHEQLGSEGLAVIGINLTDDEQLQGRSEAQIEAFLSQFGVTYPIALDRDGSITNDYRVFPLPTSFFIDPEGTIRYVHIGELTLTDVRATFIRIRGETAGRSPT